MGLNDDSPTTKSTISLELFQHIFGEIDPDIKIDSYEVRNFYQPIASECKT
jgi:hypothetical protein